MSQSGHPDSVRSLPQCRKKFGRGLIGSQFFAFAGSPVGVIIGRIHNFHEHHAKKGSARIELAPWNFLEAASGFEPLYNGFADRSLATWVCRLAVNHSYVMEIKNHVKHGILNAAACSLITPARAGTRRVRRSSRSFRVLPRYAAVDCIWRADPSGRAIRS